MVASFCRISPQASATRIFSTTIDLMFPFCSPVLMIRVAEDILAIHLEVALAAATPTMLDGLADCDQRRRYAAVAEIARHLVERLRCFEICSEEAALAKIRIPPCWVPIG